MVVPKKPTRVLRDAKSSVLLVFLVIAIYAIIVSLIGYVIRVTEREAAEQLSKHRHEYAVKEIASVHDGKTDASVWSTEQLGMMAQDDACVDNVSTLNFSMLDLQD